MPAADPVRREAQAVLLPDMELKAAVSPITSDAVPVAVNLPGAPIVVGKLSTAATTPEPVASAAALRSSGFSTILPAEVAPQHSLVARSGFGDASALTKIESKQATRKVIVTAVEILSKPRPVYTEEARRLRVEGDILLELLFTAAGEPRVLRVLKGLGHGLEAAAIESASHIGYRPATRAGEPIDQVATVRIVFQLAY
jgi:TonB family protein